MIAVILLAGVIVGKLMPHQPASLPATIQKDELVIGNMHLQPCEIGKHGIRNTLSGYCTQFSVPENHADNNGRHIKLKVAIIKSDSATPDADMVVFLDGGPGGSAINDYPAVNDAFAPLRKRHYVLLVDQRGTGGSNSLDCPAVEAATKSLLDKLAADQPDAAHVKTLMQHCIAELHDRADPRFYSTTDAVADLEAVRLALDTIITPNNSKHVPLAFDLIGVSYGTRVAQQYATQYSAAVRSIVLDSPVPNTLMLGSEHAQSLEAALKAQLHACDTTPACQQKFGDAYENLHALHDRLRAKPVTVQMRDPNTFAASERPLTADAFADWCGCMHTAPSPAPCCH